MTTTEQATPRPVPDLDSQAFWAGLQAHRSVLQRCASCERRRVPAMPSCPSCGHPDWRSEEISGTGTVFSYIVVHRTFDAAFTTDLPYTIATVDLDGGGRIAARIDGPPSIDAKAVAVFVDHPEWTELRFRIVEES